VQYLNTQHIFHPLTQNTIIAFKSRAQAIFSLSEKTTPPPPWFTKFVFAKFFWLFYIISTQRNHIYQKLDTNSCFAKLRAISNLFSFFIHPVDALSSPISDKCVLLANTDRFACLLNKIIKMFGIFLGKLARYSYFIRYLC
jgi:hypothetical protein